MTPDVQVWVSTPRNGIAYHAIAPNGRQNVQDRFGSQPCRQYLGERTAPKVRPSWK